MLCGCRLLRFWTPTSERHQEKTCPTASTSMFDFRVAEVRDFRSKSPSPSLLSSAEAAAAEAEVDEATTTSRRKESFVPVRRVSVLDGRLVLPDGRLRNARRSDISLLRARAYRRHRRHGREGQGEIPWLAVEPDERDEHSSSEKLVDRCISRPQRLYH